MTELIKLTVCIAAHWYQNRSKITLKSFINDVFGRDSDYMMMFVPAIVYFIQNTVNYTAVTLLDAATFQITSQGKILTTALFSVIILGTRLSLTKWFSLCLMVVGIILVNYTPAKAGAKEATNKYYGLLAVMVSISLSGFAGIWFEWGLKGRPGVSIFIRNIQLALFSIIPGLFIAVYIFDGETVLENGYFYGYNGWTWVAIFLHALGGITVALLVKYADTIIKGIATSISLIVSSVASVFIFDFKITIYFVFGAILVLSATHIYITSPNAKPDDYRKLEEDLVKFDDEKE
ncbi:hypothetical protein HDV04_003909 [Boothiomyces sp. JEL0838]|nr:hypothetical protein HDV04_003909 [Boothiomyces sp. JEL0838]